jgi:HlyD family secretion protein
MRALTTHMTRWLLCGALCCAALALTACKDEPAGMSGTLEPHRVLVSAEMSGRLLSVHVTETQAVKAGDLLARFDCDTPTAQLTQAQAALDVALAQQTLSTAKPRPQEVALARAQVEIAQQQLDIAVHGATKEQRRQIEASINATQGRMTLAEHNLTRQEALQRSGTGNAASVDALKTELHTLHAERSRLRAQLSEATAGARPEQREILEQQLQQANDHLLLIEEGARPEAAAVAAAQVALARAQVSLTSNTVARCELRAPISGRVTRVDYRAGEWALAGAPLLAIDADNEPWRVRTYASQAWLQTLTPASELTVRVDGAPDLPPLRAKVLTISDQPEFAAGNVQTPDERVLLVYRFDLALIDPPPNSLRAGMTVVVSPPTP